MYQGVKKDPLDLEATLRDLKKFVQNLPYPPDFACQEISCNVTDTQAKCVSIKIEKVLHCTWQCYVV